jgi:hypothetical protein
MRVAPRLPGAPHASDAAEVRFLPRYTSRDAVLYVGVLCSVALVASLYAQLPLQRVLGLQFVVGWFALDLVWSPDSNFVTLDTAGKILAFAVPVALAVLVGAWADGADGWQIAQAIAALALGCYWILTETPHPAYLRGSLRVLLLYGSVTTLGVVVARVQNIHFIVHPWFVAFVLNALATTPRRVQWWDRALHGWTWGTLLFPLATDRLFFDRFFYA